ncbi:vegetatible incompatibility het-e-1 [Fusarium subglutinans]|uniref:Vegetatible incompatibility het-e-1 n=1 Tax=Gibberella subglutinans TaxID=42677 RepID=A0A8H5L5U1_GIBSU|nr:vegetatible incompatibility het-e-1 [Fusarium subglutinans]KAF5585228.1 vegetatible incompatibility het-e-1 [Fusarium subglutinans]
MAYQPLKRRLTLRSDLEHREHKSKKRSPASHEQYEIAWICALPKEMAAAEAVLDDVHERLCRPKNDTNSYILGSIGCHNIVIACLPIDGYGTNNAVNVLTHLTRTFTSIYLSLMVGIGGGVPRENYDIRLGDIVVGTQVVQHDLMKIGTDGQIQHTAVPRTLSHLVGKALSVLRSAHQPHSSRIPLILQDKFCELPNYARPTTADRLFCATYQHSSQASSCDECSPLELVQRCERSSNDPYIHYGTIASGNQVIKDSAIRDKIAQELNAICFEMEAAGLPDLGPCLSVRGICDYSDSHKSKEWQEYAAATAAAFAREFLEKLPSAEGIPPTTPESVRRQEYWPQKEKYDKCLRDLRETDPRDDKSRIEETKGGLFKDAYRWILKNDKFQQWYNASQSQLLWIKGDPGKGKTMLLCGLIDELEKQHRSLLSYFFCQATEARLSNATAVLRGLIYLLLVQCPPLFSYIEEKYDHTGKQLFEDGNAWQALSKIFMAMLVDPLLDRVLLIVDALDECITDQENLLDLIIRSSNVKWIVTSRNWPDIEQVLERSTQKVRLHLELNQDSVSKAVEAFIDWKVEELAAKKGYDTEFKSEVKSYLAENAHGTFLWVALVCQGLSDIKVLRKRHTRDTLEEFPKGLDPLYGRMMGHINQSRDAEICKEILALASVVYRPITLTELKTLLGSQYEDEDGDLKEVVGCCGSFLTLRGVAIYFLHQSAKDFLVKKALEQVSPSGLPYQHELIFKRSLQTLSKTLRRDICQLGHPGFSINDVSADVLKPLDPIGYSCVYWVDHLKDSDSTKLNDSLASGGDIHVFIQNKYLYWLEALSLLGTTVEGVKAIYELEDLATTFKATDPVRRLLEDARRFILTHKRAIEIAPLQAYDSALIFSPESSLIREVFKHEEPDWITLKPKMDKKWNNCLQTLEGHGRGHLLVAVSPDNHLIASSSRDETVKIWDIATGVCRHTLEDHDEDHGDDIYSITFLQDGQILASASKTIKVWDTKTGLCRQTLGGHDEHVSSVASSPDGQYLASGCHDGTIKIWSSKTGNCTKTLEGHSGSVFSVAFSPNNQRLVSGSADSTVKIWDAKLFSCLQTLEAHNDAVLSVAFSPDAKRLASVSRDETIKVWDMATGSSSLILGISSYAGDIIAFTADGKCLALGTTEDGIKLFDAANGTILQTLKDFNGVVTSMAFTADGRRLISGSEDGLVRIWATSIDARQLSVEYHDESVSSIAISAHGLRVASGSSDTTVKIWDTETGKCLQTLKGHCSIISCLAFSADSTRLASCSNDCTITVWDIITGTCLYTFEEDGVIRSVAFSADDQYLVSGGTGAKIWNAATGECLYTFGHNDEVNAVALSADSRRLAAGLDDRTIRIWNVGEHSLEVFQGHTERITSVALSVDALYLASSSLDGEVRIWDSERCSCLHSIKVGAILYHLSFSSWTNSQLHTDIGILDLEVPFPMPNINAEQIGVTVLPASDRSSHCIKINGQWIVKHDENVLWLPFNYHPKLSAVFKSTLAAGYDSGRVLIMRFS